MESWQARSRKGLQNGGGYFEMEKTMKASDLYVQTPDKQNSPRPGRAVGPWLPGKVRLMGQLLGTHFGLIPSSLHGMPGREAQISSFCRGDTEAKVF